MNIDSNDPRLTAFVLGELDPTERHPSRGPDHRIARLPAGRRRDSLDRPVAFRTTSRGEQGSWRGNRAQSPASSRDTAQDCSGSASTLVATDAGRLQAGRGRGFRRRRTGRGVVSSISAPTARRAECGCGSNSPRSIAAKADTHKAIRLGEATAPRRLSRSAAPARRPARDTYAFRAEPGTDGRASRRVESRGASKRPSRGEAEPAGLYADAQFEEMAGGERVQLTRLATPRTTNDPSRVEMAGEGQPTIRETLGQCTRGACGQCPRTGAASDARRPAAVPEPQEHQGRTQPTTIWRGVAQNDPVVSGAPARRVRSGRGSSRRRTRGSEAGRIGSSSGKSRPTCSRPARRRRPANQCRAIREIKEFRCRP